ncbi:MAG: hypothetical protein QW386_02710 [Candidatus Bathyarchaeia archaeon]
MKQKAEHEWVTSGYVIGFMTNKGLILDLDNMKFKKVKWLAKTLCKRYKLEGYLIIKSSDKNYHVVFNRYLKWKTITKILFNQYEALRWAVFQMQSGYLTLRISRKNGMNKPKIVYQTGKQDKLIKDYLEIYNAFKDY